MPSWRATTAMMIRIGTATRIIRVIGLATMSDSVIRAGGGEVGAAHPSAVKSVRTRGRVTGDGGGTDEETGERNIGAFPESLSS
jgi:hypothetical protein